MKKIIYLLLLFLWAFLIYMLSNQTGDISGGNSVGIIKNTLGIIYSIFNISDNNINEVVLLLHNPVRECAHAFEYFILGFLTFKNLDNFNIKNKYKITLLFCSLFAFLDEFQQLFVKGRTFQIIDILIDILGLILVLLLIKMLKNKNDYKLQKVNQN